MAFQCTMCGMGPRATILLVGIISLLFSAGYVFFTISGVLAHNCNLNMTSSPEEYGIYLYYLRYSGCGAVNLTHLGIRDIPADFQVIVPEVSAAANRTYIFCLIGVILFGVWFITSFFSLISICTSCIGRCCIAVGIYPYVITLFLVLIYSAVAFVFYLVDFIKSFDIDFVIDLLEIQNKEEVKPFLNRIDDILLVVPPLLMWIVGGIGVLFWFMFLSFAFVMLSVASRLWAENKPAPSYDHAMQQSRSAVPATAPVEMAEEPKVVHQGPMVVAARYNDPARQPNEPLPYHQLPPSMVDVRRTIEPLKSGHEPTQDLQVSHVPLHDNRNTYAQEPTAPLRPNSMVNPYVDKRFSYMPGNPQPFSYLAGPPPGHSSPRNSTNLPEVRNQLPWSYFPPVEEATMPKRVTSTLTEHRDFPGQEISAPISKPSGAIDDRSSDEGKWSGPEYRY